MTTSPPTRISTRKFQWWLLAGWIVLPAAALLAGLVPGVWRPIAGWPFLLSLLVFGMPHGSMDWAVMRELTGRRSLGDLAAAFIPYTIHTLLWLTLLLLAPVIAVALLLIVAATHFGRADVWIAGPPAAAQPPSAAPTWAVALARGSLVISVPFLFQPDRTAELMTRLIHLVGSDASFPAPPLELMLTLVPAAWAVLVLVGLAGLRRRGRQWLIHIWLPPAVITFSLSLLPPLFGIGLFFLTWHALRECARLTCELNISRSDRVTPAALIRLHWISMPFQMPAILLFIALAAWRVGAWQPVDLALLLIALYLVLTPHHHLLGEGWSRRRRT